MLRTRSAPSILLARTDVVSWLTPERTLAFLERAHIEHERYGPPRATTAEIAIAYADQAFCSTLGESVARQLSDEALARRVAAQSSRDEPLVLEHLVALAADEVLSRDGEWWVPA